MKLYFSLEKTVLLNFFYKTDHCGGKGMCVCEGGGSFVMYMWFVMYMSFVMYNSRRLAFVVVDVCRGWPCRDTHLVPSKFKISNYRPISILCTVSKKIEKLALKRLIHLQDKKGDDFTGK
jgi:hypothetical protein